MPAARKKPTKVPITKATIEHPELLEAEMEEGKAPRSRNRQPRQILKWIDRARMMGLQNKQLTWELHVRQGHSLAETARLLEVTPGCVRQHYEAARRELIDCAPSTPEDFIAMREEIRDRLLATYEDACKPVSVTTIDVETQEEVTQTVQGPPDPRNLAIRLKCLDQLAKLHGLNLETATEDKGQGERYATPEEIREVVMQRALEQHGRAGDVAEAVKALKG